MKAVIITGAALLLIAFLIGVYVSRPAVHEIQAPDDTMQTDTNN